MAHRTIEICPTAMSALIETLIIQASAEATSFEDWKAKRDALRKLEHDLLTIQENYQLIQQINFIARKQRSDRAKRKLNHQPPAGLEDYWRSKKDAG